MTFLLVLAACVGLVYWTPALFSWAGVLVLACVFGIADALRNRGMRRD